MASVFQSNRLATRVTVIFFLAIAALLIVLAAFFAFIIYDSQRTSTAALQQETARRAAITIAAHLDSLRVPLFDAARLRPDLMRATPDEQRALLNNLLTQNPAYLELALLDDQGRVVATVVREGHHLEEVERDADRVAALRAAQAGQAYESRVHLKISNQEPYIVESEPLNPLRGALVAWINLRHVWEIVADVRIGDSGYAYVLDTDGYLIAYRDPTPIIARRNPLQENAMLGELLRDSKVVREYQGLTGVAVLGASAPIESSHWQVLVETPLAEAYGLLYRLLIVSVGLLIAGIILAAWMARLLATRLLEPVELLREGASLIGAGHLDHRIVIETGDEIEELASEFNQMTAGLRRARAENDAWMRELERRVEERTAQVIEQKQQLAVLEERQRVARELHDSITQQLFTLTITLESAQALAEKNPARIPALVDRAHQIGKTALSELRALIANLRPVALERRGLMNALHDEFAAISERSGVSIELRADGIAPLLPTHEDALYRIALEAVNNAVNHAHPQRIQVAFEAHNDQGHLGERVTLTVQDDGAGFDASAEYAGHFGLKTMRERAAVFGGDATIDSAAGEGTTVRVEIPTQGNPGK